MPNICLPLMVSHLEHLPIRSLQFIHQACYHATLLYHTFTGLEGKETSNSERFCLACTRCYVYHVKFGLVLPWEEHFGWWKTSLHCHKPAAITERMCDCTEELKGTGMLQNNAFSRSRRIVRPIIAVFWILYAERRASCLYSLAICACGFLYAVHLADIASVFSFLFS